MIKLQRAIGIGLALAEKMAPFCERVEVAGSIRRCRPWVGDVDLVVLAKDVERLKARCAEKWETVRSGPQNCIYKTPIAKGEPLQIDIFFARPAQRDLLASVPGNFGSLFLCRTGSREHNIMLVEQAKANGLRWNPYQGVFDGEGKLIASETEEEIFHALGLEFVHPEQREVGAGGWVPRRAE